MLELFQLGKINLLDWVAIYLLNLLNLRSRGKKLTWVG